MNENELHSARDVFDCFPLYLQQKYKKVAIKHNVLFSFIFLGTLLMYYITTIFKDLSCSVVYMPEPVRPQMDAPIPPSDHN